MAAGISVIYQEFTLFPDLTVAENVFIGREPISGRTRGIRYPEMRARCRRWFEVLGVDLDPDARLGGLSVAMQQLVEIAKALSHEGRVIVMDEPTAALDRTEVARLMDVIRRLRDEGRAVIYVSHHLEEVFQVADRATVLRDGRNVGTLDIAAATEAQLVRLMVGRDIDAVFHRESVVPGEVVLRLTGLSAGPLLRDVDLEVRRGEVLGVGGVAGAGQADLTQAIFGALPIRAGSMELGGAPFAPATPVDAIAAGIGFLHEDASAPASCRTCRRAELTIAACWSDCDRVRCGSCPGPLSGSSPPPTSTPFASGVAPPTSRSRSCRAATSRRCCWVARSHREGGWSS